MPSASPGILTAHRERGWSAFRDNLLSPKTCQVWVSRSPDPRDVGTDAAQCCGSA